MFGKGKAKRTVRYYIQDGPTIEGVDAGRTRTDYIVWAPKVIEPDETDGKVEPVEVSGHVEIAIRRVLWRQVVG